MKQSLELAIQFRNCAVWLEPITQKIADQVVSDGR